MSQQLHEDGEAIFEKNDLVYVDNVFRNNKVIVRLFLENTLMAKDPDFLGIFIFLLASFYIFDVKYQDGLEKTFTFFQTSILEISNYGKKNPLTRNFLEKFMWFIVS